MFFLQNNLPIPSQHLQGQPQVKHIPVSHQILVSHFFDAFQAIFQRIQILVESLREKLQKKVDVLNREQLNNNPALINEILKDGVKIYG